MTTSLTIKQIDNRLVEAIKSEAERQGVNIDRLIGETLAKHFATAGTEVPPKLRDVSRFTGRWTQEEYDEFNRNTACFEEIDEELWR